MFCEHLSVPVIFPLSDNIGINYDIQIPSKLMICSQVYVLCSYK